MAEPTRTAPAVMGAPNLTVSWKAPGSSTWHHFDDGTARAILAACASGQATFQLEGTVRRSPRLNPPAKRTMKRGRKQARPPEASESETLLVTLTRAQDGGTASNASRVVRWGFSPTCTFDRLPINARALAAMIAQCEAAKKRQILSQLLDYVILEDRLERFLSEATTKNQPVPAYNGGPGAPYNVRTSQFVANARARPGGTLYERFLDVVAGHVADLGGALQALMGSPSQNIAPLALAFHGTPPANVPSILADGMLPAKRVAGGDWFGTSPWMSVHYCQKFSYNTQPPHRIILFLLLPVSSAVHYQYDPGHNVLVMSTERYELPLGTFDLDYQLQPQPGY